MKRILNKEEIMPFAVALLIGIAIGLSLIFLINEVDTMTTKEEINSFILNVNASNSTLNQISNNTASASIILLLITILQISCIFSPLIILIDIYKGVQIGFLMSAFIKTLHLKGLKYAVVLLPKELILSAVIIIYSAIMFKYSKQLYILIKERKSLDIRIYAERIALLLAIGIIISIIAISICTLISTKIIKII